MPAHPITLDQLNRLAVDDAGRLFWDGREVLTTLSLPWYVNLAVIVGASAAVVNAFWPIVRFYCFERRAPGK